MPIALLDNAFAFLVFSDFPGAGCGFRLCVTELCSARITLAANGPLLATGRNPLIFTHC
nr:MAG TPA: hypothetical protein [Caudoviricetes sp.]